MKSCGKPLFEDVNKSNVIDIEESDGRCRVMNNISDAGKPG